MSFGVREVKAIRRPPRFGRAVDNIDRITVILPNGERIIGFVNLVASNGRFFFKYHERWYAGPVMGRNFPLPAVRGLCDTDADGLAYADLRKFVEE